MFAYAVHVSTSRQLAFELAARQHGVLVSRQLRGLGVARSTVQSWVNSARLERVSDNVFIVTGSPTTALQRGTAAVLACGPGAALGLDWAAAWWGLGARAFDDDLIVIRPTVLVPPTANSRQTLAQTGRAGDLRHEDAVPFDHETRAETLLGARERRRIALGGDRNRPTVRTRSIDATTSTSTNPNTNTEPRASIGTGTKTDTSIRSGTKTDPSIRTGTKTDTSIRTGTKTDTSIGTGTKTDTSIHPGTGTAATRANRQATARTTSLAVPPAMSIPMVTTPLRTALDLARRAATLSIAEQVVDQGLSERLFTVEDFADRVSLLAQRAPGTARLRSISAARGAGFVAPDSVLEAEALTRFVQWGLPAPVRRHLLPGREDEPGRVDFAWPAQRVLVEVNGRRWHASALGVARDAERDRTALAAGWKPYRYWAEDFDTARQRRTGSEMRSALDLT